ncbi:13957_t:CDS:1, partial [Cetraspora pellucida]
QRLKEAKKLRERNRTQNSSTSEPSFSRNNPYINNNLQDKEQTEDSMDTKSLISECVSDNEEMILENEVAESTINEKPSTTANITDVENTDSMEAE